MKTTVQFLTLLLLSCSSAALALEATPLGEVAFRQALRDMGSDFRLMSVAAHPDDEDGATLAYYRMRYGVETYAAIATRGEGGQNEIGPELYEALGVIRTHEMMDAAAIEGARLRFLDLPEFGYSKTRDETYALWGEEETLRRMVRLIREVRPHVIITHHGRMKDHGHHQAIGDAVQRAFDAAADPRQFPEQLEEGLRPWQVERLYIRNWEGSPHSVVVPIATLAPYRGQTYAEIAADALWAHRSQGMGFFIERLLTGRPSIHYDLVREAELPPMPPAVGEDTFGPLFDGLPWAGFEAFGAETLEGALQSAGWRLSRSDAPRAAVLEELKALLEQWGPEQSRGAAQIWRESWHAAALGAQVRLTLAAEDAVVVPGQQLALKATLRDFGAPDVGEAWLGHSAFGGAESALQRHELAEAQELVWPMVVRVPEHQPLTLPQPDHLFDEGFLEPQVRVEARLPLGALATPELPPALLAELYVDVAPPVQALFLDAPYLALPERRTAHVDLHCTNFRPGPGEAHVRLLAPPGVMVSPKEQTLIFAHEDEEQVVQAEVTLPPDAPPGDYPIEAMLDTGWRRDTVVRLVDVAVPQEARVGVVQSYDDTFIETLARLEVPHEALGLEDFTPERLDGFSTIIVDIRAYQYRPDLVGNNQALLDYVARGGTLVVMYQKTYEWESKYAPYPLRVSRNRVTREDAPVRLLAPEHPLFTTPNAIEDADWAGWIQERGLYFPDQWDDAYTPLIALSDPGEDLPPGSLLVADYVEGRYIYTALGLYRQLRALHPGALRMFANMLAW